MLWIFKESLRKHFKETFSKCMPVSFIFIFAMYNYEKLTDNS